MMLNPVSKKSRRVRALALIPATAVALLCISNSLVASALNSVASVSIAVNDDKDSEKNPEIYVDGKIYNGNLNDIDPTTIKEVSVEKNSGNGEIHITLLKPGEKVKSVKTAGTPLGVVYAGTIKKTNGTITYHENPGNDDVTVYVNGEKVSKEELDRISPDAVKNINIDKSGGTIVSVVTNDSGTKKSNVENVVEKMPEYPGGIEAMMDFLAKNIRYPESMKKENITATVLVQFVVGADGTVSDPKIMRGGAEAFNEEAIRVVNMLPKFIPGTKNGKPIAVHYSLPIRFKSTGK